MDLWSSFLSEVKYLTKMMRKFIKKYVWYQTRDNGGLITYKWTTLFLFIFILYWGMLMLTCYHKNHSKYIVSTFLYFLYLGQKFLHFIDQILSLQENIAFLFFCCNFFKMLFFKKLRVFDQQSFLLVIFVFPLLPTGRMLFGRSWEVGVVDQEVVAPIALNAGDRTKGFLLQALISFT